MSVDERDLSQLIAYAAKYAEKIKYFNLDGLAVDPQTNTKLNWSGFFEKDETVFLATLQASDIHGEDEKIQTAFLKVHQLQGSAERVKNFKDLVWSLLKQTERLFSWYRKAQSMRESDTMAQVAREIDRALRGELGYQLHGFAQIVEQLGGTGRFLEAQTWLPQLREYLRGRTRKPEDRPAVFQTSEEDSFDDLLHFSASRLQDYYRRLYFTLSYLEEITPDLFERSITKKSDHDPDMGLLIAFLRLFAYAQEELNKLSGRHLEYYEKEVLGRRARAAIADRSVLGFVSGNPLEGIFVPAGTRLLAGVNGEGLPSHYETDSDLYLSQAKVVALKTLFVSKNPLVSTKSSYRLVTAIYAAPVANSFDGVGGKFPGVNRSWPVLGEDQFDLGTHDRQMSTSTMGFALASSILRLSGGERKVTVQLRFTQASFQTLTALLEDIAENTGEDTLQADVFSMVFNRPFRIFLTGEEEWIPIVKYLIEPGRTGDPVLSLQFILPTSAPPAGAYSPDVHADEFQTEWPVLKVLLSDEEPLYAYSFLRDLELEDITLKVAVDGVRNLGVYNDLGLLDASRPFVPFGPLPRRGSYMLLGHPELFNKNLTELDIEIEWAELPESSGGFADHYAAYDKEIANDSFRFTISALSDFAFQPVRKDEREEYQLFTSDLAASPPLRDHTRIELKGDTLKKLRFTPLYHQAELEDFSNTTRSGYLKFELSAPGIGFGHTLYPRIFARRLAENARPRPFSLLPHDPEPMDLPNEPYTPVISRMGISYEAETVINLRPTELKENSDAADDRLFRLHPFGVETVYASGKLKTPFLLPRFDDDGYLYIGLSELHTARPLSLYFNIEDSKKKITHRPLEIQWHYLNGDDWKAFGKDQMISDSTVMFSTRGIVQLYCPQDMTKGSGLMDPEYFWLRVSASGNLNLPGRCSEVVPHVVEVVWNDNGDPKHLTAPPPERPRITALEQGITGLTGIMQLSDFYGGLPAESEEDFYVRGSERLRHKNRAVSVWDYERLILDRFPDIQQAKCIGRHGHEDVLLTTGRVLIVVVPRITGMDITPKVGFHVLAEIEQYLGEVCSPFVRFQVINPVYEPLKINCSIKLRDKSVHKQGQVWKEIHNAVTNFICPWLTDGALKLGGSISKTDILSLINENQHVAFATAFSIVQIYEESEDSFAMRDTAIPNGNSEELTPSLPWSVLVPVFEHHIEFLEKDAYQSAQITAIEGMRLGADFIISEVEDKVFDLGSNRRRQDQDTYFDLPTDWLTDE